MLSLICRRGLFRPSSVLPGSRLSVPYNYRPDAIKKQESFSVTYFSTKSDMFQYLTVSLDKQSYDEKDAINVQIFRYQHLLDLLRDPYFKQEMGLKLNPDDKKFIAKIFSDYILISHFLYRHFTDEDLKDNLQLVYTKNRMAFASLIGEEFKDYDKVLLKSETYDKLYPTMAPRASTEDDASWAAVSSTIINGIIINS
jgi:hypothetical protein